MKTFFFIIASAILVSCGSFGLNPMGYEILHEDLDTAWARVAAMEYQDDPEHYFKSPTEFFRDGGGDCEDFAAALVYLLGPEAEYVAITSTHPPNEHMIVRFQERYLEPQNYQYYYPSEYIDVIYVRSHSWILCEATWWGIKHL